MVLPPKIGAGNIGCPPPGHFPLVTGLCVYQWGDGRVDHRCVLLCNLISPWADAGQASHHFREHFQLLCILFY